MSAAEKLAALESPNGPWLDQFGLTLAAGAGMTLRSALPEIIAVVKAAEEIAPLKMHWRLEDALSALDEKLGAVGSAAESETPAPRRIVKANSSDLEEWKP